MIPGVRGRFGAVLQEDVESLAGNVQLLWIEDPEGAHQKGNSDCREDHPGSHEAILLRIFGPAVGRPGGGYLPVGEMIVNEHNHDDQTKEEREIGDCDLLRKII